MKTYLLKNAQFRYGLIGLLALLVIAILPKQDLSAQSGYTWFSVAAGYTDSVPHQIVRSNDDRLYLVTGKAQYSTKVEVRWTSGTGLPSSNTFSNVVEFDVGAEVISVDAAYNGQDIIHILTNTRGNGFYDTPFNIRTNTAQPRTTIATNSGSVSGEYIGTSGITGAVDTSGTLHTVYWRTDNHIAYQAFSYNQSTNVLQPLAATMQLDSGTSVKANHPSLAISPVDNTVTVVWLSNVTNPTSIFARTRATNGTWGAEETVNPSNISPWTSVNSGINVDQGPSIAIDSAGTRHLAYIENYDSTGFYGHVHYVRKVAGGNWTDTTLNTYSHNPAIGLNNAGDVYIIGHGAVQSNQNDDIYVTKRNSDGSWTPIDLFARHSGNDSFDSSVSTKWSVVGWNRPETIEFVFFNAVGGNFSNLVLQYGRINSSGSGPTNTPIPTATRTLPPSNTPTRTPTNTPTNTPTRTPTNTPTNTPIPASSTPTNTATNTAVPASSTPTNTATNTPIPASSTPTNTATNTAVPASSTPTDTPTNTAVPASSTPTDTPTNTAVPASSTPTNTATNTPPAPPSSTPSKTPTLVPSSTPTLVPSNTPVASPTSTSGSLVVQISSGSDDVNDTGSLIPSDNSLWVGNLGSANPAIAAFRFNDVTIPQGSTITSAHLEVNSYQAQWISLSYKIAAEAADDSAAFTTSNRPAQRTQTTAAVTHTSDVSWSANTWYSLNDMTAVIQQVVSRDGWQGGNSLSVILTGLVANTYSRKFVSAFESNPANAARLVITYTSSGNPSPTSTYTPSPLPPTAPPFPTATYTPSATPTAIPSATATYTPVPSATSTATATSLPVPTATYTPSATATSAGGTQTMTFTVKTAADDVNEDGTSFVSNGTTIWIGTGANPSASYTGLRFTGVTIPAGATIQSAHLEFYSSQGQWIPISLQIAAEAADNSAAFSATSKPSGRPLTTSKVNHSSNANWANATWNALDEIRPIIQEVINRGGWQNGNSLSIIIKGTSTTTYSRKFAAAFENNPTLTVRLVVTYTS